MKAFLIRCYPARWRARYAEEFLAVLDERPLRARDVADVLLGALDAHLRLRVAPSALVKAFGVLGIVGGLFLLSAFVIGIPEGLWDLRMTLYLAGAMTVAVGVHRRQVDAAPVLTWVVATAVVAANGLYLARAVIFPNSPWHPFAGDNGMVFFVAGLATWIADASFGLVAWRLGRVTRWGAAALAIGSGLAILGMDRFELSPASNPTIFGPLGLIGVALNGVGWVALGLDVVLGRSAVPTSRSDPAR